MLIKFSLRVSRVSILVLLFAALLPPAHAQPNALAPCNGGDTTCVPVGAGSYNTTLPSDPYWCGAGQGFECYPPSNSNFQPVSPRKTNNAPAGAFPTNKWWSSMAWQFQPGNNYSTLMHPWPLQVAAQNNGLALSHQNNATISSCGNGISYCAEYHYTFQNDLTVGVVGLNASQTQIDSYTDWTVTGFWDGGANTFRATVGSGLPFAYFTKGGADAQVILSTYSFTQCYTNAQMPNTTAVTLNGNTYGLFAPNGSTWNLLYGNTFQSALNGQNYFAIALLPDCSANTVQFFQQHAFAFVTGAVVSYTYEMSSGRVTTTYAATVTPMNGTSNTTLLGMFPHQWKNNHDTLTAYMYATARGLMKVIENNSYRTELQSHGILPALPNCTACDATQLQNYVTQAYQATPYIPQTDTYWVGKALGRAAQLVFIADQIGDTTARDAFLNAIETTLTDWFTAPDGKTHNLFYYNSTWGTLIGFPANRAYAPDAQLNDHHFHWGYYIFAAATLAHFKPQWAQESQYGAMVNLLIKDAANWERSDTQFPYLRTFDPYEGHAWASGHANFGAGNNQESSSEAMNFAAVVALWGDATNNPDLRALGAWMYTQQAEAIHQYVFDVDHENFPASWNGTTEHPGYGVMWGDGGTYNDFFTPASAGQHFAEDVQGINYLPITGASLYLGYNTQYNTLAQNVLIQNIGGLPFTRWTDILWEFSALSQPAAMLMQFNNTPNYPIEPGDSKAHTYHWLGNLNAFGQVDLTITANILSYAVFTDNGTVTYVGYNPSADPLEVTFSDGASFTLPPGQIVAHAPTRTTQNKHAAVHYGGWRGIDTGEGLAEGGGIFRESNTKGDTARFQFTGNTLTWLTQQRHDAGKARVKIDGVDKGVFDLYAKKVNTGAFFVFENLGAGKHSMEITVLGRKNPKATGSYVAINGFDDENLKRTRAQSHAIVYSDWRGKRRNVASENSVHASNRAGATISFSFNGTRVVWLTARGKKYGKARVTIDGVERGIFDLYNAAQRWQAAIPFGGLSSGAHTIKIQVLGEKNSAANGTSVVVDGFIVE